MYKSIVITGALVASIATASAQSHLVGQALTNIDGTATDVATHIDTQGRVNIAHSPVWGTTTHTFTPVDLVTQEELANHVGTRGLTGFTGDTGATGARGERGETGATGSAGRNGVDGVNGQDGRDGVDGINGQDGQDANTTPIHMGIAGNTALSTAFAGGDGIGFGIGANEYGSAAAIGVTKSFGRHSFSAGATSSQQASFGYKFKW